MTFSRKRGIPRVRDRIWNAVRNSQSGKQGNTVDKHHELDPKAFRNVLGHFTTGVTIITTRTADGEPVGITANSFNSVSLNPPMVLWSLAKTSRSLSAFLASEYWGVHILSAQQEQLSNRFAKSGEDKFFELDTQDGIGGVPLLDGCCARLQCKTAFQYEGGDHLIFVGEVLDFDHADEPPLVFHAGRYALATQKAQPLLVTGRASVAAETTFGEDFLGYLLARSHFQFYAQVRPHARRQGISDDEYFILTLLAIRDDRSLAEMNRLFSYTGYRINEELAAGLQQRGLLEMRNASGTETCHLTEAGRNVTLRTLAAAKAMEVDIIGKLGSAEAIALKNLLKRFISQTDPGLAHPWDESAENSAASHTRA